MKSSCSSGEDSRPAKGPRWEVADAASVPGRGGRALLGGSVDAGGERGLEGGGGGEVCVCLCVVEQVREQLWRGGRVLV